MKKKIERNFTKLDDYLKSRFSFKEIKEIEADVKKEINKIKKARNEKENKIRCNFY